MLQRRRQADLVLRDEGGAYSRLPASWRSAAAGRT